MFFLFLTILSVTVWALCYKYSLRCGCHPLAVIPVVGASALSLLLLWELFHRELVFHPTAFALGMLIGISMFSAVVCYFYLVRAGARLGVSWTIITLSMMVPVLASVIWWKEYPSILQSAGLLFACAGIVLLGRVSETGHRMNWKEMLLLAAAFIFSGTSAVGMKTLASENLQAYDPICFVAVYLTVLILGTFGLFRLKRFPGRKEIGIGAIMGAAGIGNVVFIVGALQSVTGTVAFPTRSCGNLLLTVLASYLLWRERINNAERIGLALAIVAVVLLNL